MADFFNKEASLQYDAKNKGLAPIAQNMHFLIRLMLRGLPHDARILCVGVGTGAEILSLAQEYPAWTFVGVDPSEHMLEVCREHTRDAGVYARCEFIHGYVHDVPDTEKFDAVLSILVGHFVRKEERQDFYGTMYSRLKEGGYLIDTEISYDLESGGFPSMLRNWEQVQASMGATKESLQALPNALRDVLTVLPPAGVEEYLRKSGFHQPVPFFQSFMIIGWYAVKE
jgi:tRNA (cmo5U34)-methyltransferase